jgi:hypothetical protein
VLPVVNKSFLGFYLLLNLKSRRFSSPREARLHKPDAAARLTRDNKPAGAVPGLSSEEIAS